MSLVESKSIWFLNHSTTPNCFFSSVIAITIQYRLFCTMGARLHKLRIVVWGEAPDSPEERKVRSSAFLYA